MGTLHVKGALACFFSELSAPEVFDDVLIVDSRGEVVFQQGDASIRIRSHFPAADRHQKDAEGGATETSQAGLWPVSLGALQKVELAGQQYAIFRQPVRLPFIREHPAQADRREENGPLTWQVVGIVRSDTLMSEAFRFAPTTLGYLVAFVVLTFCALPLVEVWAASARERIIPRQVWTTSLGLALGTGVLTLVMLDLGLHWSYSAALEKQLKCNANRIESALKEDLTRCLVQLEYLNDPDITPQPLPRHEGRAIRKLFQKSELWDPPDAPEMYPHLKMIFWTDSVGKQVAKWAVGEPTPMISVAERRYFQRAKKGDL